MNFDFLNKYRVKNGFFKSDDSSDFGLFFIPTKQNKILKVLSSGWQNGEWYHVSASLPDRCPTWDEMSKIKELFYGEDVTVVQFHPKKSEYVNNHQYCLHLWMKNNHDFELPPSVLTGINQSAKL